jgi:low temperature requirement protein LtrA
VSIGQGRRPSAWYDYAKSGMKLTEQGESMSSRWAARLLRGPEDDPGRATFLDLFFDLVFVFALFRLSQKLLEQLTWSGAFKTFVLLLAFTWVWGHTAAIAARFDLARTVMQVLVIGCMFGSFVLAASAPAAFGPHGLVFAVAYVATQVGRSIFLVVVARGDERQRPEWRELFWFMASAVPWLAGGVAHGWARGVLWAVAVTVDGAAFGFGLPVPGMGRMTPAELNVSGEFLAERQRQFVIIALGELILVSGVIWTSVGFGAARNAAVVVAFATTVLLWRIYIYRAGELLGAAIAVATVRVLGYVFFALLVMVAGVVAVSVGDKLVIAYPSGHTEWAWVAVMVGGPALFLGGRAILEYAVFGRVSRGRVIGVLVLAAISPVMILLPPLIVAAAAAVVLAGVAVADAARARRHPAEPPSPPERSS